ncbi:MAG TPA: class I SAM-dependent methyltransferase [Solirubrobacteraceae bacterium]|jgi:SAM-dependent methyltransferase
MNSAASSASVPDWLYAVLGQDPVTDNAPVDIGGARFSVADGILREQRIASRSQAQTAGAFGFKWEQRETFESEASLRRMREWLVERYGDIASAAWWREYPQHPIVLDAGCGAAMSALELFGDRLAAVNYLGVEISEAIDVAAKRFAERGLTAAFMQADITRLPLPEACVDVIFSEGVLHHTDSTRGALLALAPLLKPGGRFLFYVYRRKGPIREFTDDYIRRQLQEMTPAAAWEALKPLSRLGEVLGQMAIELDVPEDIPLLEIPAGPIDLQRFFYWHIVKAFYRPDSTFDEMHHINYDWYAPANAHRQSPDEVEAWCAEAHLEIEHENVQDSGITIVARRRPPI